ncbi:MAG: 30S ribosomal protein S6 [Cellulomonadaceae bacterium]|jgi:small subunit ribosomal protein S6|nr:30S ribosomal protein S6 [Cellulomonadaceae bacterium]
MRKYEIMVILDPEVDERAIAPAIERLLAVVPAEGGTVDKVDVWGRRRMTFDINKKSEGIYVVVDFTATSATAQELDRQLGLNETVLRTKIMRKDAK